MEKQTLLGGPLADRSPTANRKRAASRAAIFTVVTLWALLSWQFLTSRGDARPPTAEPKFRTYPGESIRWRPCGDPLITDQDQDLECGTINVPMDHFASAQTPRTDGAAKAFTVPLVRMRGRSHSATNLLISLGGPGASGVAFLRGRPRARAALRRLVGDGLHIIGFDSRGVSASTPPATCYASEASRARLRARPPTSDLIRDSPYLYAWATNHGRACQDNAGEHLAYVNTPQTAADLNVVLDALGQGQMAYWGVGYGALLGQVYATAYPSRVGRVVLDALPDQKAWFEELLDARRHEDADAVVDGFFEECARAGEGKCALAGRGVTGPALRENVTRVIDALYRSPASAYVSGSAYGVVDDFTARIRGLLREMHTPAHWPALARRLADLRAGDATGMFLAYAGDDDGDDEAGLVVRLNDGRSGPAGGWPQPRMRLLEKMLLLFDRRRFAIGEARALHVKSGVAARGGAGGAGGGF
ncbi:Alpha/beta hydrolase fold-1 [Cordyceps fumosorosea ARSEF 2679]|uniref:Alpha/beta hydrolase fold-1 n=1 Tax=Cordyceps fumosorosea (strain ARSEF 2679) TaxID=1081104 RepID=A0A167QL37_CORFA|nr:Alpha/beta hydrolase fold-1 [Cordyceps fumosorosea ARSEF 2679]OAA57737.1 Alpha/beta hydrolase fold-1 [Cordyceps fumosorosea ARSEF 2679]